MAVQTQEKPKGPNLEALGFKSPMEVIDVLALMKIDGKPIINDPQAQLDPKLKAQAVMEYFQTHFNIKPQSLPYFASAVKREIKNRIRNGNKR